MSTVWTSQCRKPGDSEGSSYVFLATVTVFMYRVCMFLWCFLWSSTRLRMQVQMQVSYITCYLWQWYSLATFHTGSSVRLTRCCYWLINVPKDSIASFTERLGEAEMIEIPKRLGLGLYEWRGLAVTDLTCFFFWCGLLTLNWFCHKHTRCNIFQFVGCFSVGGTDVTA